MKTNPIAGIMATTGVSLFLYSFSSLVYVPRMIAKIDTKDSPLIES